MKKAILFGIAMLFCVTAVCDEGWSDSISFDGSDITTGEKLLVRPTDPLAYSSVLAEGSPKSLMITATDKDDSGVEATIFLDDSGTAVEGTTSWDYTDEA
jgi:hypothetical protein